MCQYDYNYTMPEIQPQKSFGGNMLKSIVLAACVFMIEIALYFVYYQRVWERR
jgi:hypothetical protein